MSSLTFNITVSGASVSGDLDVSRTPLTIDLGNSDRIGQATFSLQNKDSTYSNVLFSGNALFQIDAMQGNALVKTVFAGTLEKASQVIDIMGGSRTDFTGYDYGQELLGLVSPDARQASKMQNGAVSLTSGDQGMSVLTGMDMVLYVSGAIGSGTVGYPVGGYTLGKPLAASMTALMSQYFGKSGDTTGTNSGQSFSFKPYASGMTMWGTNPFYRCWYAPDVSGASAPGTSGSSSIDTNGNYWIPYDTIKMKHEVAWDVLKKITRQSYVIDRSGTKTQFELYIGVSGDMHLRTSGSSDFIASGISLVYYKAGNSGSANNNVQEFRQLPWDMTNVKNFIVGWFPTWTQYPFSDDYSDLVAYSGAMWSGSSAAGTVTLSGDSPAPGAPGFISIMATNTSGTNSGQVMLTFTLWSGYSVNVSRWNVSGGNGVVLAYKMQASIDSIATNGLNRHVVIYDMSGNYIIKSGGGLGSPLSLDTGLVTNSGWGSYSDAIYTGSGTFLSGTGGDGGWKAYTSGNNATSGNTINQSGSPDLTNVHQIAIGFGQLGGTPSTPNTFTMLLDNIIFGFVYNYNPIVVYDSGSVSTYRKRYEVFEFPYQYTDSGAAGVVAAELQGKMYSRQLAEIIVKDNPNLPYSAQLGITPGQAFVLDAPSVAAGSGQFYNYFVATQVTHKLDVTNGFITTIMAYPWFSGATVLSGHGLITYSLTTPLQVQPRTESRMPNSYYWLQEGGRSV